MKIQFKEEDMITTNWIVVFVSSVPAEYDVVNKLLNHKDSKCNRRHKFNTRY